MAAKRSKRSSVKLPRSIKRSLNPPISLSPSFFFLLQLQIPLSTDRRSPIQRQSITYLWCRFWKSTPAMCSSKSPCSSSFSFWCIWSSPNPQICSPRTRNWDLSASSPLDPSVFAAFSPRFPICLPAASSLRRPNLRRRPPLAGIDPTTPADLKESNRIGVLGRFVYVGSGSLCNLWEVEGLIRKLS